MAPALQNDTALVTESDATTLPSIAPAAKSNTAISPFAGVDPAAGNGTGTWRCYTTSPNIAPATKEALQRHQVLHTPRKSHTTTSPDIAPATKKGLLMSLNIEPATKRAILTSLHIAPATKKSHYNFAKF